MGLPLRSVAQEDLIFDEQETKAPESKEWPNVAYVAGNRDPLSTVRGVVLGVISGGILWGLIFWGISLLFR